MTIDALRKRKQELVQKKQELESQPQSGDNTLLLEIVQEELLDVNAQLRTLEPHRTYAARRIDNHQPDVDRQQFLNWQMEDLSFDDKIAQSHIQLREETVRALARITLRQREALEQKLAGKARDETARALGITRESVTNLAIRAKRNMQLETEKALATKRLLAGRRVLDMMEPDILRAVLLAMTPTQAVYFYLHYSEGLFQREIARLLGRSHRNTVCVSIARALRRIDALLYEQDVLLKHPEALDELGYRVYCELCAHPELAQAAISPIKLYPWRSQAEPSPPRHPPSKQSIHVQVCKRRISPGAPPGKLRAALMESGTSALLPEELFQALVTVFSVCRYKFEQPYVMEGAANVG